MSTNFQDVHQDVLQQKFKVLAVCHCIGLSSRSLLKCGHKDHRGHPDINLALCKIQVVRIWPMSASNGCLGSIAGSDMVASFHHLNPAESHWLELVSFCNMSGLQAHVHRCHQLDMTMAHGHDQCKVYIVGDHCCTLLGTSVCLHCLLMHHCMSQQDRDQRFCQHGPGSVTRDPECLREYIPTSLIRPSTAT